jgi:hypothetical protein
MWGLGQYTAITKGEKSLVDDVKRKLHLKHKPTEKEESEALQRRVNEAESQRKGEAEAS